MNTSIELRPFKRGGGLTSASRSRRMATIGQKRTAPEERVAEWLREHHIPYRRNVRTLPGSPDFANQKRGFAIFVHGCFWHRHAGCARATSPTRNAAFWQAKFDANVARDRTRLAELEERGLCVLTIWECDADHPDRLQQQLEPLAGLLQRRI